MCLRLVSERMVQEITARPSMALRCIEPPERMQGSKPHKWTGLVGARWQGQWARRSVVLWSGEVLRTTKNPAGTGRPRSGRHAPERASPGHSNAAQHRPHRRTAPGNQTPRRPTARVHPQALRCASTPRKSRWDIEEGSAARSGACSTWVVQERLWTSSKSPPESRLKNGLLKFNQYTNYIQLLVTSFDNERSPAPMKTWKGGHLETHARQIWIVPAIPRTKSQLQIPTKLSACRYWSAQREVWVDYPLPRIDSDGALLFSVTRMAMAQVWERERGRPTTRYHLPIQCSSLESTAQQHAFRKSIRFASLWKYIYV